jgi:uroporphyrinogen-III synthase
VLDGFTIGVTADRRWEEQASLFERRGAAVMHGPTIRTLPVGATEHLQEVTDELIAQPPRFVVANTGIGIRSWFGAAESWGVDDELRAALATSAIVARGPKASAAIHAFGLEVVARGRTERLAEAVDFVVERVAPGDRVAVQRDGGPSPAETAALRAAGAEVVELPVYEWQVPDDRRPALRLAEAVIGGRVHAVTFTAGPQVRNWFAICEEADLDAALQEALSAGDVIVACVGPVCAESAVACGLPADRLVVPAISRLGPLVRAVAERLFERTARVSLASGDLVLAGNVARLGDHRVELSDTEARLLASLAARPGAVVGKQELLRQVWGDAGADPHLVEVAVGRLRRRLGAHGTAVAAVPRRGYRLAAS